MGLAIREPSDALHIGVSSAFQSLTIRAGSIGDSLPTQTYAGHDTNAGIVIRLSKNALNPTLSVGVRHLGNTTYTASTGDDYVELQDMHAAVGATVLPGSDVSLDVGLGGTRLDRQDLPVQDKARIGLELGVFGRGRDALATFALSGQKIGASCGAEINLGILSFQAANSPLRLDAEHVERRSSFAVSVDLSRP